jgi:hypothetical protein
MFSTRDLPNLLFGHVSGNINIFFYLIHMCTNPSALDILCSIGKFKSRSDFFILTYCKHNSPPAEHKTLMYKQKTEQYSPLKSFVIIISTIHIYNPIAQYLKSSEMK